MANPEGLHGNENWSNNSRADLLEHSVLRGFLPVIGYGTEADSLRDVSKYSSLEKQLELQINAFTARLADNNSTVSDDPNFTYDQNNSVFEYHHREDDFVTAQLIFQIFNDEDGQLVWSPLFLSHRFHMNVDEAKAQRSIYLEVITDAQRNTPITERVELPAGERVEVRDRQISVMTEDQDKVITHQYKKTDSSRPVLEYTTAYTKNEAASLIIDWYKQSMIVQKLARNSNGTQVIQEFRDFLDEYNNITWESRFSIPALLAVDGSFSTRNVGAQLRLGLKTTIDTNYTITDVEGYYENSYLQKPKIITTGLPDEVEAIVLFEGASGRQSLLLEYGESGLVTTWRQGHRSVLLPPDAELNTNLIFSVN